VSICGRRPDVLERARAEVESLPSDLFYVGLSSGVLAAQSLAQTRPGASGAVLCYSAVALGQWGDNWPATWPDGGIMIGWFVSGSMTSSHG